MSAILRNISRKRAKKERHPFDVDVYIEKVSEVPDNIEAAVVALVRAPRAERTNLASNSGGVCMWDQTLRMTITLFKNKDGTWEKKEYNMTVEGLAKGSSDRTKLTTLSSIVLDFADYAKGNFAQPNDSLYFNMPGLGQLKLVMRLTPHVDGETEADMAKRRNSGDLKTVARLKRMSMRTMGLTEKGVGLGRMSVGQGARKHMQQIEARERAPCPACLQRNSMVGGYVVDMQKRSMGQAGITGMDNLVYGERETDAEKGLRRTSAYTAGLKSRLGEQDSNLHRISAANVQMAPAVDTGR